MPWNVYNAIKHLQQYKQPHSTGRCAQYVREAVEAGGVTLIRHVSAKDYGSSLTHVGFMTVQSGNTYFHHAGDVGVIQPIPGHPHGHIAMYDGNYWISDFLQHHGLYPGKGYRDLKPAYQIYRHPNLTKA